MPTTDQILTRLSSQVSEIHKMLHEKSKPRYVKVGAVKELTGWTEKNGMGKEKRNRGV
jgi:hypothetical protein